jgi:CDP-diglyceride synthetase
VGKNLGRTKLTEISPKKTVEGAIGGLASSVLVAAVFWQVFGWPGSMAAAAGYGVSCAQLQRWCATPAVRGRLLECVHLQPGSVLCECA